MMKVFKSITLLVAIVFGLTCGLSAKAAEHQGEETVLHAPIDGGNHGSTTGDAMHDNHTASEYGPAGEPTFLKKFGYSYLTAYMFFLSICLGSLFIVLISHLLDTQWIVPIRRYLEHIACQLFPTMFILFLPIMALAHVIYPWFSADPHMDHALHAKWPLFTRPAFYIGSVLLFLVWGYLTRRLRYWSVQQDVAESPNGGYEGRDGLVEVFITAVSTKFFGHSVEERPSVKCSRMMNLHASYGIIVFALSLTLASIYWMKGLQHQWFSTMYGVYYFAGSVWVALATSYLISLWLKTNGPLQHVVRESTFHDTGKLFFAFTVFYSYIHFSQYFLIWNAAIPEETFWYVQRERGSWWWVGQLLIFGHFFLPFLLLLRIDTKLNLNVMIPMGIWAWAMHYFDMQFNVMPVLYPEGLNITVWDPLCIGFLGLVLWIRFNSAFASFAPYPQRDPRIAESMGVYVEPEGSKNAPAQ